MAVRVCTLRVSHSVYPSKQAPKAQHARSGELTHKPSRALRRARASIVVSVTQREVRMADRANVGGRRGWWWVAFEAAREHEGREQVQARVHDLRRSQMCGTGGTGRSGIGSLMTRFSADSGWICQAHYR